MKEKAKLYIEVVSIIGFILLVAWIMTAHK